MHKVKIESEDHLLQTVNEHKDKLIIYMFTAEWCGPCKRMKEHFNNVENDNAVVCLIDVDNQQELTEKFSISSMPTFMFLKINENNELVKVDEFKGGNVEYFNECLTNYCNQ